MLLVMFCAIFAPWVAPHNPSEQYRDFLLTPPVWLEGGQMQFLLGTDELGRDLLSRLIQGSRLSLLIGLSSVVMSLIPGSCWVCSPVSSRDARPDHHAPDGHHAGPAVAAAGGGDRRHPRPWPDQHRDRHRRGVAAVLRAPDPCRGDGRTEPRLRDRRAPGRCRPAAPDVRHRAAQLHGAADRSGHPEFLSAILDAAALGFLGLGVQPPTPEWGTMLASARDYIERAWWVVSLPGLTILLSVLAINLMGDGLRDALDPKLKNAA
jgi:dipeptide transport system permease protein